jgi:hypothetical protein
MKLDTGEKEILESVERGEWRSSGVNRPFEGPASPIADSSTPPRTPGR